MMKNKVRRSYKDTLLEFPCEYPIKIMGHASDEFEVLVLTLVSKHVEIIKENAIRSRHSKDQKYLSMTLTLTITSKEQLDALYLELSAHENILFVL